MPALTERQQIEAIYQTAPVGLCVLDRELRYVRINDRLAQLNGLSPVDHLGRTLREVLPEVAEQAEPIFRRVLEGAQPIANVEIEGYQRVVVLHCLPLHGDDGGVVGLNIVVDDITNRKRTEQALRESETRFRALADNIAQLAWMANETGWIFWYNRRWFEYTGTTLEEMQGWGWQKVHHPDYVGGVVERIKQSFVTGTAWEDTFPLRSKEGTFRWFLSRAMPIRDDSGNIVLWVGTNTDVTEQRHAEEALREADRRKNEFLLLLGHELRNPLAPILTAANFLQLATADDPQLQTASGTIVRQARQAAHLVDDLMDVGRITAGKLRLDKQPVSLSSIVTQAIESCTPNLERRRQQFAVSLPADDIVVEADQTRLVQVISNLLDNAAKYSKPGGRIELSVTLEATAAVIRVCDNGVGIPPAMLGLIFDPLVQIGSTDRRNAGLGLGLSLVKSLVELHGGSVEARSAGVGHGSEFVVRLPVVRVNSDHPRTRVDQT